QRLLPRRIDLGEKHHIPARQRLTEFAREIPRARIQVRLKRHDNPTTRKRRARGIERRADLGRMMRVVIHNGDPPRFPQSLKSALDPMERCESRSHRVELYP